MNMKQKLMISALSVCAFSTANAYDLSDFVKVQDGLYANLAADGTLTEVAVTTQAKMVLDSDESDANSEAIRNLLEGMQNNEKAYVHADICVSFDVSHNEVITQSGNSLTLTATGAVAQGVGPFPPAPDFAYARAKAKLKGYGAGGTAILKSMDVDRQGVSDSGATIDSKSLLIANYANASATAQMNTAGLTRVNWTAKTDYLVDNPYGEGNNGGVTQMGDCYQSFSVKVTNDIYL